MPLKKLKIYDLDAFLRAECGLEAFRYQKVAIFEGERGVVVAEHEAVHKLEESLSSVIEIGANKPARPGTIWILPTYTVSVSIAEIKTAPYEEMTMDTFFDRRTYNIRCMDNWSTLLRSLSDIGFDLSSYLPEKQPLQRTIRSAQEKRTQLSGTPLSPPMPEQER